LRSSSQVLKRPNPSTQEIQKGDIAFTNVQVQSESQLVDKLKSATITKHGSDLYFCPLELAHHRSAQESSEKSFADNIHKKMSPSPCHHAGIQACDSAQPWGALLAHAKIDGELPFPAIQELDSNFDHWPK
jgi:hypothetical protein